MTKKTFKSPKNIIKDFKRDDTVKLSDLMSPVAPLTGNNIHTGPMTKGKAEKMAKTGDNWNSVKPTSMKAAGISKQNTLKPEEKLFTDRKTNAAAHKRNSVMQNNLMTSALKDAGKMQMGDSSIASNNKGFGKAKSKKKTESVSRPGIKTDLAAGMAALRAEYAAQSKRKIVKRKMSKSPAVFKLDSESPYAEYLPDLYREYKPKERKLKSRHSNKALHSVMNKIDRAYSENFSIRGRSRAGSRAGSPSSRGSHRFKRSDSNNKSLKRISTLRSHASSISNGNRSVRSNSSKWKGRKGRKQSEANDDSFYKLAALVKSKVANQNKD